MPLTGALLHQSADWHRRVKSWCHVVNFFLSASRLFVDFCDGWKVGTRFGCEVLFSVKENGRGNSCNAWNNLQGSCTGENTSLRVVFPLQEWWIVTCRPTPLRATLDLPNGWKHCENSWTDLGRPSQNNWRSCWFVWCVLEFLPTDLSEELQSGEWWLHHDNAPAHKALSVKQFLTKNSMTQLLCPPYSPGLTPCGFFLFPRMKKVLKGKRFADVEEVKKKTTALKGITFQEFQDCFEKWKTCLDRCIVSNGQYFEGEWICNT